MFGSANPDIFRKPPSPEPPPDPDQFAPGGNKSPDFGRADPNLFRKKRVDAAPPSPDLPLKRGPDFGKADPNLFRRKDAAPPPEGGPAPDGGKKKEKKGKKEAKEWSEQSLRGAFTDLAALQRERLAALKRGDIKEYHKISAESNAISTDDVPPELAPLREDLVKEFQEREAEVMEQYIVTPGATFSVLETGKSKKPDLMLEVTAAADGKVTVSSLKKRRFRSDKIESIGQFSGEDMRRLFRGEVTIEDALSARPKAPDAEASPATPPPEVPDLDTARKNFARKKQELEDIRGLKRMFGGRKTVALELAKAEKEYQEARATFVEASAHGMMDERMKLVDEEMQAHAERKKGTFTKFTDWYKGLGRLNLERAFGITKKAEAADSKWNSKTGKTVRFFLRAANVRTAVSAGLLGAGLALGVGSIAGIAAFGARRLVGGLGAGIGTYDLSKWGMDALGRRMSGVGTEFVKQEIQDTLAKNPDALFEDDWLADNLATLERRAMLNGRSLEDLRNNDETYQLLLAQYEKALDASVQGAGNETAAREYLEHALTEADRRLREQVGTEKVKKLFATAIGISVATVIGSGMLAEWMHGKTAQGAEVKPSTTTPDTTEQPVSTATSHETGTSAETSAETKPATSGEKAPPPRPETGSKVGGEPQQGQQAEGAKGNQGGGLEQKGMKTGAPEEPKGETLMHGEVDSGARVEVGPDGSSVIHAGSRGIEGAMLDYLAETKTKDPSAYAKMIEQLKEFAPKEGALESSKELGNAIHKLVTVYAEQNDTSVARLDRIAAADIRVSPDGKFEIVKDSIQELKERAVGAVERAGGGTHEQVETGGGGKAEVAADASGPKAGVESGGKIHAGAEAMQDLGAGTLRQAGAVKEAHEALSRESYGGTATERAVASAGTERGGGTSGGGAAVEGEKPKVQPQRAMEAPSEKSPAITETQTSPVRLEEVMLEARKVGKASEAVSLLFEKVGKAQEYGPYLKDFLQTNASDLDSIQSMNLSEFQGHYLSPTEAAFKAKFTGVAEVMDSVVPAGATNETLQRLTVKDVLLEATKGYLEQKGVK